MPNSDIARRYDRVASSYNRIPGFVLDKLLRGSHYRSRAIELLGDINGSTVLDIGCGTGLNFPLLAERVGPSGRIIGVDCSAGMLREACKLVESRGWRNVELVQDDAETLRTVEHRVDAVLSVWCYGLVDDLEAALDQAIERLRPGGTIVIMTFVRARTDAGILRPLYPIFKRALQKTPLDGAGLFDDERLRARWARGRAHLRARLGDIDEINHLFGTGAIFSGRKPATLIEPVATGAATNAIYRSHSPN